jgi:hypothetical protein
MSKKINTQKLYRIISKNISEQKNLDNYQSNFTAEDFNDWVNSEWDIETLEMVQSMVQSRIDQLYQIIDIATKKEVKGFK